MSDKGKEESGKKVEETDATETKKRGVKRPRPEEDGVDLGEEVYVGGISTKGMTKTQKKRELRRQAWRAHKKAKRAAKQALKREKRRQELISKGIDPDAPVERSAEAIAACEDEDEFVFMC